MASPPHVAAFDIARLPEIGAFDPARVALAKKHQADVWAGRTGTISR